MKTFIISIFCCIAVGLLCVAIVSEKRVTTITIDNSYIVDSLRLEIDNVNRDLDIIVNGLQNIIDSLTASNDEAKKTYEAILADYANPEIISDDSITIYIRNKLLEYE